MNEQWTQADLKAYQRGEHVPPRPGPRPDITSLVVELPLPNFSPNSRGHWGKRHRLTQAYRNDARLAAKVAMMKICRPPMWDRVTIQATFHKPSSRAKLSDADNLIGSLKPAIDGIQDAGIIVNDSGVTWLPPVQLLGKEASEAKVVLVITKVGAP